MLGTFVRCFIFGKDTYREKNILLIFFYSHNLFTQFIVFFSFDINVKQRRKSVKNILQTVAIIILYFSFLSASLSGEICYATCIWNYKKTKWLLIELKKKQRFEFWGIISWWHFICFFPQVSMVYNLPRATSVRAASPCVVLLLDRVDLNRVLRHYPAGTFLPKPINKSFW